ncbi:MAG TPA: DNA recombination protein RmuC [Acidimicrobiales bacterium]|nr:DNA recombination protein RmuC [Acidimicrobiales bacterium]
MVLGTVIGLVVGLALGLVLHLVRSSSAHSAARTAEARLSDVQASSALLSARLDEVTAAAASAETARAVLAAELDLVKRAELQAASRQEAERRQLIGTFAEVSADALAKNNEQFLALAETKLSQAQSVAQGDLVQRQAAIEKMLAPLTETLTKYEQGLRQMEIDRKGAYEGLREKVNQLSAGNEQLHKETRNLVTALRSPQTRGRWGEITLRRVVEMAGMLEHCDFNEQVTTVTAEGRLRPDMIVHMPGGREMVVDSKVPLDAFLKLVDADADRDVDRAALQMAHARQLRSHVEQLAKKEYWRQFERSPDQVVAFIPGDQLLSAAYEADPSLQEYAMANGVLLTTPTMLIALLRSVAFGWRQESLAENAKEIQKLGAEMYDRLRIMCTHLQKLQRGLMASVTAYNDAVGSLESRVLVTARRFPELGVLHANGDIDELTPIAAQARHLQAIELVGDSSQENAVSPSTLSEGGSAASR